MDWLFQMVYSSQCYSKSCSISLLNIFRSFHLWRFSSIIQSSPFIPTVHLFIIQSCTQVSVLLSSFFDFCGRQWLKTLFRGLLHINAARKAIVVHLMQWQQLFPTVHLFIIQPCTQVSVLLSSFFNFLGVIVVENTVQTLMRPGKLL